MDACVGGRGWCADSEGGEGSREALSQSTDDDVPEAQKSAAAAAAGCKVRCYSVWSTPCATELGPGPLC